MSGCRGFWKAFLFSPLRRVLHETGTAGRKPSPAAAHVLIHVTCAAHLCPQGRDPRACLLLIPVCYPNDLAPHGHVCRRVIQ